MQGTDSLLELEGVWPCYTLILEYLVSRTVRESTSGFGVFCGGFFCLFFFWGGVVLCWVFIVLSKLSLDATCRET